MPIIYKQHGTAFQHSVDDLAEGRRVLLFDPVTERSADTIGDRFRRLDAGLRDADLIIVRGADLSIIDAMLKDPIFQNSIAVTSTAALCGSTDAASLTPTLTLLHGTPTIELPAIDIVREAELRSIFIRTGAIFRGSDHHFALPSNHHADQFVRIGEALRDPVEIRRLTDWLIPHIGEGSAILADTGSIIPLVSETGYRAYRQFGWDIPYDCLGQYPKNQDEIRRRLQDLTRRDAFRRRVVFVVSVNSSGQTLELVANACQGEMEIVTICDTHGASTRGTVLSSLSVNRWPANEDGRCPECDNTPPMTIDPETYERIPVFRWTLVPLRHDAAEDDRCFWEIADAAQAVQLHVSNPYKQDDGLAERHFGVFLDTIKLVDHASFRAMCIEQLKKFPAPDIVLVPDHDHTAAVERVLHDMDLSDRVCRVPPLPLSEQLSAALRRSRVIWIVDDAVVTGATLRGFRSSIHEIIRDTDPLSDIFAFALLARTSTKEELKDVSRPYRQGGETRIRFGATIFLPRPGREPCPWCQEKQLLANFLNDLSNATRQTALDRIHRLDTPVEPPILLGAGQRAADLVTAGSFFGDLHQKTAFAACVSAVQRLRDGFRSPQTSDTVDVMHLGMILSAYFEAVFPAAVLRTCSRAQMHCPQSEPDLSNTLRNVNVSKLSPGTIPELGLAAALGTLPSPEIVNLITRAMHVSADPVLPMLLELIQLNIKGRPIV